jgi:adenosine deaminase
MAGNNPLIEAVKKAGIHVECQPFSNVSHIPRMEDHPIVEFAAKGLSVSLGCDNLMFSGNATHPHDGGPSLQLACMKAKAGLSWEQIAALTLSACHHLFGTTPEGRTELRAKIAHEFAAVAGVVIAQ